MYKVSSINAIIRAIFPSKCYYLQKSREKPMKSREKIVALLAEDGKLSAVALADKVGISAKAVEKHLANLKADGIIKRIGPAKGGHWIVRQYKLPTSFIVNRSSFYSSFLVNH